MSSDTRVERLRVAVEHIEIFDAQHHTDLSAQIGLHHRRIAHDGFRRALGDRRAVIEHQHARGKRHHRAHDVLDQQDREAALAVELAQNRDHAVDLGRPQSGDDFVEQQQFRLGGERAHDFEPLAVRQRQRRRGLVAAVEQVEAPQQRVRALARRADVVVRRSSAPTMTLSSTLKRRKRPHQLERARDAAPAHGIGRQALDRFAVENDRVRRPAPSRRRSD